MYLSVKEAKAFGIEVINEMKDEELTMALELYSGVIDEYCRTKFVPTKSNQKSNVLSKVRVEHSPLITIESIDYLGNPLHEGIDFYVYEKENLFELEDTSRYSKKKKSLTVNYVYGFEDVPAIVKKVLIDLIKINKQELNNDSSMQSESFDSEYSYTRRSDSLKKMEQEILSSLDIYRQEEYEAITSSGCVRARLL